MVQQRIIKNGMLIQLTKLSFKFYKNVFHVITPEQQNHNEKPKHVGLTGD